MIVRRVGSRHLAGLAVANLMVIGLVAAGATPADAAVRPVPAITSFTASSSALVPAGLVHVTADLSSSLFGTGHSVGIYDSAGRRVNGVCSSTASCNGAKSLSPYTTETFTAYLVDGTAPNPGPPAAWVSMSGPVTVSATGWSITGIEAEDQFIEPGERARVTATADVALGHGYYLAVYDADGRRVSGGCGSTSGCTGSKVLGADTIEVFRAYVVQGVPPTVGPPPNAVEVSGAVIVSTIPEDEILESEPYLAFLAGVTTRYAPPEACYVLGQSVRLHSLRSSASDATIICNGVGAARTAMWLATALGTAVAVAVVADVASGPARGPSAPECPAYDSVGECLEEPGVPSTTPLPDPGTEPEPGGGAIGGTGGVPPPPNCLPPDVRQALLEGMPEQFHHMASDKHSEWSPQFQEIADRYGLSITDSAREWNVHEIPHRGPHHPDYHRWVWRNMERADEIADGDTQVFLDLFDRWIVQVVRDDPTIVRWAYWDCP